ncbi:MAG TPA: RNA polymerase sigma-54 factor [Planctomycetes bacterium]|nr:RNA polymerase sigma-54 factor [Planctomycetota bacterium]
MHLGLSHSARMEHRLVQSPQMIQAMQILQLSSMDLQERIAQELTENPFLEIEEPSGARSDQEASPEAPTGDERSSAGEEAFESMIETLERYERDFGDGRSRVPTRDGVDRKFEAMQNTPAHYHGIGDVVTEYIALSDLEGTHRALAEYIAYSLDDRGYLIDSPKEVAEECGIDGVTEEDVEEVLQILRHATHPALGAHDLQECLLLQVDAGALGEAETPLVRTLITEHIEDIVANRLPRIARATGHTLEEVKHAIESIRALDPVPGREYGEHQAETIHPDVVVEEEDGEFKVRLTREGVPDLRISSTYRRILKETAKGDAVRQWIQKRLETARWFIDALQQRESTLLRVAKAIFDRQKGFLERGIKGLTPLRMQEVADATGVHISTVSRAVAGKSVQTPHGILPLRSFFSGGTEKASGGMASQASIKQRIRELIEAEDPKAPLSDDRLAELLRERDGISIARRTVTKYRKSLDIPSSGQRRQF